MAGIEVKQFSQADETVSFEGGYTQLVTVGPMTIGREVEEPGWRWSTHVKPIAGTERCEFHHIGIQLSGITRVETRDGEIRDLRAGDVYDIAPGHDAWVLGDEPSVAMDFQGIADWAKPADAGERQLTTVLFTDIVGSTAMAERLGDVAWKQLLASHQEDVRGLLEVHRGHQIKMTGDGFLATFDSPERAILCAIRIGTAARKLGIEVRAGVHTGEVELTAGDVRGVSVHVAARIMDAAGPGEVLVSATTRELAGGGRLTFVDRGSQVLKGVSGERVLFSARLAGEAP